MITIGVVSDGYLVSPLSVVSSGYLGANGGGGDGGNAVFTYPLLVNVGTLMRR